MSEVQSVQWFPGHMAKTRRAIQSSLKLVDIVAELIDARIPVSSRNPVLKSIIGNKPKIVLLNKSDMADPARTAEWVDYFKQHKTVAIPIDCKTGKGLNRLLPEIKNILREQIAAWERKGMVGRPIRIMVVGVPNVGKSSLLNLLTNRKSLARVSGNPGKTRTINFYRINDAFRIVDLPGYGYAKVSKSVTENWGAMMEEYFENRQGLKKVVQLVDIRHAPSAQDQQMYEYLRHYGMDGIVVATKADKVSRNELQKCMKTIRQTLKLGPEDLVIPVSALKKSGCEELLTEIEKLLEA